MAISLRELIRDFVVVDQDTTIRKIYDRIHASGSLWTYVVVRGSDGGFAVLWLAEIVEALQWHGASPHADSLNVPLARFPELLGPLTTPPVEQASLSTGEALDLARLRPNRRLVVVTQGQVLGLLALVNRSADKEVDFGWLDRALATASAAESPRVSPPPAFSSPVPGAPDAPAPAQRQPPAQPDASAIAVGMLQPGVSASSSPTGAPEAAPAPRWVNVEIEHNQPSALLLLGQVYTLAFDVDTEARAESLVQDAALALRFGPDDQAIDVTIQLATQDFDVYNGPQTLRVPRAGRSKGKARFDIEPRHEGAGVINAVLSRDGNFIQRIAVELRVGEAAALVTDVCGRPLDAASALQPRDLTLFVEPAGTRFQVTMCGAVSATATLPITVAELAQRADELRQVLLDIVQMSEGPGNSPAHQRSIDVPAGIKREAEQRLAKFGFRLYQRLFYGSDADAQTKRMGDRLREMAQSQTLKIQVVARDFALPWSFLYLADRFDPDNIDPERILGLKHVIEHIPLQPSMDVVDSTIPSRPNLRVGLSVNADIDRDMGAPIIGSQMRYWEGIRHGSAIEVSVREGAEEVIRALADTVTHEHILYFCCHAFAGSLTDRGGPDAAGLVFGGNRSISLEDLDLLAPRQSRLPGAPLVFLNACESAELSPLFYEGFVPYFMAKGARGVIGTECQVPALFAAEWAQRFFQRLLGGAALGTLIRELRREFYERHNNILGLLYTIYCNADTRIAPAILAG